MVLFSNWQVQWPEEIGKADDGVDWWREGIFFVAKHSTIIQWTCNWSNVATCCSLHINKNGLHSMADDFLSLGLHCKLRWKIIQTKTSCEIVIIKLGTNYQLQSINCFSKKNEIINRPNTMYLLFIHNEPWQTQPWPTESLSHFIDCCLLQYFSSQ